MGKKDKGPGCLMYVFFLAVLASLFTYMFFSNTFNFKTLISYGPSQYVANIWHFHRDYYCRAATKLDIYGEILPANASGEISKAHYVATIQPGQMFKLKGYRTKEYVTWVAAKLAKGTDIIYGYFMVPEKIDIPTFWATFNRLQEIFLESSPEPFSNKYFSEVTRAATEGQRNLLLGKLKEKLRDTLKMKGASDPVEMQKVKESNDVEIIDSISSDTIAYYVPKSDYEKAEALYDAYLGDGFDTQYLQVSSGYDPSENMTSQESLIVRFVDRWYFKVFVGLLLFWLYRRVRSRSARKPSSENADSDVKTPYAVDNSVGSSDLVTVSLSEDMSIRSLKEQFIANFGVPIRVYTTIHPKRLADDNLRLADLRDVRFPIAPISLKPRSTVSQIEEKFREVGIGIQVMKPDGSGLATNDSTIRSL